MTRTPTAEWEWKALATDAKNMFPDAYLQVTGLPVWWDQVGHEYHAAERKWLSWVKKNAVFQTAEKGTES